jgi:hypothetical protein
MGICNCRACFGARHPSFAECQKAVYSPSSPSAVAEHNAERCSTAQRGGRGFARGMAVSSLSQAASDDGGHAVGALQRVAPIGMDNGDSSSLCRPIASLGLALAALSGSRRMTNEMRFIRTVRETANLARQHRAEPPGKSVSDRLCSPAADNDKFITRTAQRRDERRLMRARKLNAPTECRTGSAASRRGRARAPCRQDLTARHGLDPFA